MAARKVSQRTTIDRKSAGSILFPIAAVLSRGGLSKGEVIDILSDAYDQASKTIRTPKSEHIGNPLKYGDVVQVWMRDKRFLDKLGRPRALSMNGRNGFSALVRQVGHKISPRDVLSVLIRYGNVCRIRGEKYSLIESYFNTTKPNYIAFEPHAYFLSDASVTLGRMLKGTRGSQDQVSFWRKVENVNISEALVKQFFQFSRQRSLAFLEEMDDWLEAHANPKSKGRRVGLGVFSIYSKSNI